VVEVISAHHRESRRFFFSKSEYEIEATNNKTREVSTSSLGEFATFTKRFESDFISKI